MRGDFDNERTLLKMSEDGVKCVELTRSESHGFGFSILGGSGSELPPIVYDIVENSPASVCGQVRLSILICDYEKEICMPCFIH